MMAIETGLCLRDGGICIESDPSCEWHISCSVAERIEYQKLFYEAYPEDVRKVL